LTSSKQIKESSPVHHSYPESFISIFNLDFLSILVNIIIWYHIVINPDRRYSIMRFSEEILTLEETAGYYWVIFIIQELSK